MAANIVMRMYLTIMAVNDNNFFLAYLKKKIVAPGWNTRDMTNDMP